MKTIRMDEMTWPDIKSAIEVGYETVIAAVGSTEQHGPHLPEMTDTRIGDEAARRVAVKLGRVLQASTIRVGCSSHHLGFPGTISLRPETLKMIILDYAESLLRSGFKTVVFLPMHGGNFATVRAAVEEAQSAHKDVKIIGVTDLMKLMDCLNSVSAEFGIGAEESGAHAGESETSLMLALEEDLVVRERFAPGYVGPSGEEEVKKVLEGGIRALTENGVMGDPTRATAEKGEVYLDRLTDFLIEEIKAQLRIAAAG